MSTDGADLTYDVFAVGHAIVDVLCHCDDGVPAAVGLARGAMTLVDEAQAKDIYAAMGPSVEISGGSAANTAVGVASLGGKAAFAGRIADDEFGAVFGHDIRAAGVAFTARPAPTGEGSTARCHVLVTPDAERTMGTYLGVAGDLSVADVDMEPARSAAVSYLEGYLLGTPGEAALHAVVAEASAAKRRVALTLSDPFWVDLHRGAFSELVPRVDVLFANEVEALSLTGEDDLDAAVRSLRDHCPVVTVTCGERGALVAGPSGEVTTVPAHPVERVVDTTGAGDLYAAGFLFGLVRGLPLPECAALGALAAAEVISHDGARPAQSLAALAAAVNRRS